MPRYGLATLLEDIPVGCQITDEYIPLHLTHIDVMETELNVSELEMVFLKALGNLRIFTTAALEDKYLGPGKDILVTELELTSELKNLQSLLLSCLTEAGVKFENPQFLGENFKPHITVHDNRRVLAGDMVSIDHIVIGESSKIVSRIPLAQD